MNVKQFVEALESAGYAPRSYSGRGMYGAKCVAIVTDDSLFKVAVLVMPEWPEDFDTYEIENVEQDNMGRSTVYYWPNMEWCEDFSSEDDEEEY